MKKFLSLAFVAALALNVYAEQVAEFPIYDNPLSLGLRLADGESMTLPEITVNGVTLYTTTNTEVYNDDNDYELAMNNGDNVVFSCDYPITKIEVAGAGRASTSCLSTTDGNYEVVANDYEATWTSAGGTYYTVTFTASQYTEFDGFTVYYDDTATSVKDVNASKTITGVTYVNMAGQTSKTPFQGVNVVVTTMADGTTSVAKVIK
ncbi:MAG: hypothetical protein J6I72_08590 [Muribaculaceae bacterium]|nr:hypothetical protein [Muribaculaceae bacterium]